MRQIARLFSRYEIFVVLLPLTTIWLPVKGNFLRPLLCYCGATVKCSIPISGKNHEVFHNFVGNHSSPFGTELKGYPHACRAKVSLIFEQKYFPANITCLWVRRMGKSKFSTTLLRHSHTDGGNDYGQIDQGLNNAAFHCKLGKPSPNGPG